MFEKILVPLDGSENSIKALEVAVQIALKFNGKITLIHVYSLDEWSREYVEILACNGY